jgi:two-component system, NarL family, response regulator
MNSDRIRILLVEDDELFRLGLQVRLQQELELDIIAEAADGETAVELTNRHPLDLVLLDIGLPRMGGIEACRQIVQQHPNLPILALTSHSQNSLIARLIEVGAQGYCLKGVPAQTLILAIRSVAAGASWWDSTATREIRTAISNNITEPVIESLPSLTGREREILALIARGKSDREIAEVLYIAPGTVRVHIHAILQKLNVQSRDRAVAIAKQKNLIALQADANKTNS